MTIKEFQKRIEELYLEKDKQRPWQETFMWLVEEVGELGRALRSGNREEIANEFADVLAWTSTIASLFHMDLEQAALDKYALGCPKCGETPCRCPERNTTGET